MVEIDANCQWQLSGDDFKGFKGGDVPSPALHGMAKIGCRPSA